MFFFHITYFNDSQSPWQQYHITKLIRTSIVKFHSFYIYFYIIRYILLSYVLATRKVFFMIDETGFEIKSYRTCSSRRISQMKYDFLGAHTSTYYTFVIILLLLLCRNAVKKYKNSDLFGIAAIINISLIIIYK